MSISAVARKCPSRQSENLEYGNLYERPAFVLGKSILTSFFSIPYPVSAYLCLDCGVLGCYLDEKELTTLRKNLASKNKTK